MYHEAVVSYEQHWAENLGWSVSIAPFILGVLLGSLHTLLTQTGSLKEVSDFLLKKTLYKYQDGNNNKLCCFTEETGSCFFVLAIENTKL